MASPQSSLLGKPKASSILIDKLAPVLPKGYSFGIYHLSTPPTKHDALYNPPPGTRPDKTYCESHFLAVTIPAPPKAPLKTDQPASSPKKAEVLILAIEIYIFTTAYSSTFFVSKADSTGYLQLLQLPKSTLSPIREVAATFIDHLLEQRRRKDVQSIVSLFARSQSQYLFPGSVKNTGKHVLDDRGLVRWWCRVLDPLLTPKESRRRHSWRKNGAGYLIVPGLDDYETRAFIPRVPTPKASHWTVGHPLESISHYCQEYDWVPPRCLIPKYPDDPKSRFRDELDEESANWKKDVGAWKSVKSLEQFWEMMAFRHECSSGRLTGFIWVVFDDQQTLASAPTQDAMPRLLTPNTSFTESQNTEPPRTPPRLPLGLDAATPKTPRATPNKAHTKPKPKKKKPLKGLIVPRQPRVKRQQRNQPADQPAKTTAYYHWPLEGRGAKIVDSDAYKRCTELLLHLDFATVDKAVASTTRWVNEVGMGREWKLDVRGAREAVAAEASAQFGQVNNLAGMIKRKRDPAGAATSENDGAAVNGAAVNVLGAGLVRKKRKSDAADCPALEASDEARPEVPQVNVLGPGLVRKKPKAA